MSATPHTPCPCQSSKDHKQCCQPYHAGIAAPTPEALMRSRFSAYAMRNETYLLATWHNSTRPSAIPMTQDIQWRQLTIVSASEITNASSPHGTTTPMGTVHFKATYQHATGWACLEEKSHFCQEDGRWYYIDGTTHETTLDPKRNDPCPCGSGIKFKKCCGKA